MCESRLTRIIDAANKRGLEMQLHATPTIAIRPAHDDEADAVRRLARLDDSPPLDGDVLLGLVDGAAVAALSLTDGRVVANPFVRTAEVVTLLDMRASQLSPHRTPRRLGFIPARRAA
jgi:hypothetical protein